jgi:addiction module RelB/DinJ family antitoxin
MAQVNIRIDDNLKEQSEEFFKAVGLTMSSAITLFLHQVILQREIPFKITKKTAKQISSYPVGPLDPFLISPSGDPYWSHPENVAALEKSIQQFKQGRYVEKTMEELEAMANG